MQTLKLPPELVGPPKIKVVEPAKQPPPRPTPPPQTLASVAKLQRRHHGVFLSLVLCVGLPLLATLGYLYGVARDQFASTVSFSVREENMASGLELLGGLTDIGGGAPQDADILYAFIQSQQMVQNIRAQVDLTRAWSTPGDPIFALSPLHTIEDLHKYWARMVRVTHDTSTGLIDVRVRSFDAHSAQVISNAIYSESQRLVNALSDAASQDATRQAAQSLANAQDRVATLRATLTQFRNTHLIVDPAADLQGRMGLLSSLQAQKAAALIDLDVLLAGKTRRNDPRIEAAQKRIEVVEGLIASERENFGPTGVDTASYTQIVSQFEEISIDLEFAQQAYVAALASHDAALADARRTSKFLAAHVKPTLAEKAQYPTRALIVLLVGAGLFLIWMISVLIYYAARDRR